MKRLPAYIVLLLAVAQLALMVGSWIYSAAYPVSGVQSLLSSEGLRWFLGHFADVLATPVLVWLLLLAMAYGALCHSGLLDVSDPQSLKAQALNVLNPHTYRGSRARLITGLYVVLYVGVIVLMTFMPHALLLSASGSLWPSPFSASLVPVTAFGLMTASLVYGTVAGTFRSLTDVYDSLLDGIRKAASLLLFYVLLAQLYFSLCYVVG